MKNMITTLLLMVTLSAMGHDMNISSPNGRLHVAIHADADRLTWEVRHGDTQVTTASEIGINGPLRKMKGQVSRDGHSATLSNSQWSVTFRADDDAAAYRIGVRGKRTVTVSEETAEFNFAGDYPALIPYVNDNRGGERWCYSFESYYDEQTLSQMYADSLAINPLAVRLPDGKLAVVLDASAVNYPGMFLVKSGAHSLRGAFAPYPVGEEIGGYARLNLVPTRRAGYIARMEGGSMLPWRIVCIAERDSQLPGSDLSRRYGPACQLSDTTWIKPGKVAWDWWNNTNLTGVDFRAGMNTATYKYYIDFASANHLEYIIIDEGWSSPESLTEGMNPEIDLPQLLGYAKERGVGIILWTSWRNCIQNMERDFKHYADMGVKGFKVDFFDRDDQVVMLSAWEMAACAARHHLLLDYHGYRPTGIQYAFPNIVNFEGVKGLENSKWEPRAGDGPLHDQPRYDVTIPYLRMLVGPLDYTPGAMTNATRDQFFGCNDHPMSQGTRAHQVAMYTIFDAPLQMLADSPTKYQREPETTAYISSIPTVWDETKAIDGVMGEYVVMARRSGSKWYVAAMTNWTARDIEVRLDMLGEGSHTARLYRDGLNADRDASDYRIEERSVARGDVLRLHLAPGGGATAIIE